MDRLPGGVDISNDGLEAATLLQCIENMSDGLILLDSSDRFVFCNARYRAFYPEVEDLLVPGTPLDTIIRAYSARIEGQPGMDAERHAALRDDAWRGGRSMEELTPAGRWIETRDYRASDGHWIGIRIDVTERRRIQEHTNALNATLERRVTERTQALAAAQDALARNARLAAIGEVAASVSHELRNPLGTIRSSLATLSHYLKDPPPKAVRARDRLERNIVRCVRIIDELLAFARAPAPRLRNVDLDRCCADAVAVAPTPQGLEVGISLQSRARVRADRQRLDEALQCLLQNAWQAAGAKAGDGRAPWVCLRTENEDGMACISIVNGGPHIPAEQTDHIFEPLFSTKAFGVGLGLALVKRIAEEHGGEVRVDSTEERTVFQLRLPSA